MRRRKFLKAGALSTIIGSISPMKAEAIGSIDSLEVNHRDFALKTLLKICRPVLKALANDDFKSLNLETAKGESVRLKFAPLEALGRISVGLLPYLSLKDLPSKSEISIQTEFKQLFEKSLENILIESKQSYVNFGSHNQCLVDASFLVFALLESDYPLPAELLKKLNNSLLEARKTKPYNNNWLLFSAMVELWLVKQQLSLPDSQQKILSAVQTLDTWYIGDGFYKDGPLYHHDYYNSFVIHPYMLSLCKHGSAQMPELKELYPKILKRAQRYTYLLERSIAPDGSFPLHGRSICYRSGVLNILSYLALSNQLPDNLSPQRAAKALYLCHQYFFKNEVNFTKEGLLKLGFQGHQPNLAEVYITTASLYLTTFSFQILGIHPSEAYYSQPMSDTTSEAVLKGTVDIDKSLKE